jgi:hypothetical protein
MHTKIGKLAAVAFTFGVIFFLLGGGLITASATQPPDHKVTLCHATDSETNPYVVITVDIKSAGEAMNAKGHASHTGPIFQPGDKAKGIDWGDIIPPYTFFGFSFPGLNATPEGLDILANGCKVVTASPSPTPSHSPSPPVSPTPTPCEECASPTPTPSTSPSASPSASPSVSPSASPSVSPSASPTPTTGGGGVSGGGTTTGSAPTGGGPELANTGSTSGPEALGAVLTLAGLTLMTVGAVAWRRRNAE